MNLIRANIERILKEKGWKGSDLARALGTSDSHVSQIRTGNRWSGRMEWKTYRKFCDALEVDELELIKPPPCANEGLLNQLAEGVAELPDKDDIALMFKFLAILKHKEILNPEHFQVLVGTLSMLQEELMRKRGIEVFITPLMPRGKEAENATDQGLEN